MKSTQTNNLTAGQVMNNDDTHLIWNRVMKVILLVLVVCSVSSGQVTTTHIQDTVYHADGTYAQGSLVISWPAFTTATGATVPAGNVTAQIGSNGLVSFDLTPNIGATPAGTFYTAVYHLDNGTVSTEYWVVPATTTTTITAMRSKVMPASVAVQLASQSYIESQMGQYLPLAGGSLQGSLVLNSDPATPLQAATKEYVDSDVQAINAMLAQRVEVAPTGGQVIQQPGTSTLAVNNINNVLYASQYGSTTGIANAVSAGCAGSGCHVIVDPGYGNEEAPQGYTTANYGFTWPVQTFVQQERNGVLNLAFHSPGSSNPEQLQGVKITSDFDRSEYSIDSCCGGYAGSEQALDVVSNYYTGMDNTQNTFNNVPMFSYGGFHTGLLNTLNSWDSGQKFGQWNVTNCYGVGDCLGQFDQLVADGGINRRDDEGVHWADIGVGEDPNVFTGVITGSVATGATTISTSCTYGCATQGQDRLLIDTNPAKLIQGTFKVGLIYPIAQMPPGVTDPTANYPVSTFALLCYAGDDNGAGGATACAPGNAPTGYIPPNAQSATLEAPASTIVTSVVASYSGIPAGVCTSANLQSSNPAAACYMPASGVGCLTDLEEYETVNYTFNAATQQITLDNLRFPHVNGMAFATGGLCGYAVEVAADIYTYGTGGNGVQSQVFPVEGALNATTLYYIPQRTNEGYGLPVLGTSADQNYSGSGQLSFSTTTLNMTLLADGKTVEMTLNTPPGVIGAPTAYNALSVSISSTNPTYNGSYPITYIENNGGYAVYTYQPSPAPTGTTPSTATVSYSNLQYTLYPSARTNSVYNTTSNSVDGTFYVMPNAVAWAPGDTVRQPHYQQMDVTAVGGATNATQFIPHQYLGNSLNGVSYQGLISGGVGPGYDVVNATPTAEYIGMGGTHSPPGSAFSADGVWLTDYNVQNAAQTIVNVAGCPAVVGCYSALSNFNLFALPPLPNIVGSGDRLNYDPSYASGSRAGGLYSGKFSFSENPGLSGGSYATVELGYGVIDRLLTAPTATIGGITSGQSLLNIQGPQANVIGTPGSTMYQYYGVAHTFGGGVTLVSMLGGENSPAYCGIGCGVPNGNAVLNGTNYIQLCVSGANAPLPVLPAVVSYDVLKLVGSTYYLVGNISNGCVNDQGQTLSAYTLPTVNTSGSTSISGLLAVSGVASATTVNATTGYQVNGTALSASNLSNGVTGSGTVVLASNPTLTGTLKTTSVNATTGYQVNGTALSASNLSNGVTGSGTVVLATSPMLTTPNADLMTGTRGVTFAAQTAAGSGATVTCYTSSGNNCTALDGMVQLVTGTSPTVGNLFLVTWTGAFPHAVNCVVGPGGGPAPESAAALEPGINNGTTTSFAIGANLTPVAHANYYFMYVCAD